MSAASICVCCCCCCYSITSSLFHAALSVRVSCWVLVVSAVPSKVGCYSGICSVLCCHPECKDFVLGPSMSFVHSNVVTRYLSCCHIQC